MGIISMAVDIFFLEDIIFANKKNMQYCQDTLVFTTFVKNCNYPSLAPYVIVSMTQA
jgi:hypothetical protein